MDFPLPQIGEGVYEAELVRWLVKPGDSITPGQSLAEVMTDKATMEVPAPFAGTVTGLRAEPGGAVKVGGPFLIYTPADEAAADEAAADIAPDKPEPVPPTASVKAGNGHEHALPPSRRTPPPAAPSVRQMARKLGIDLASVPGTGPAGRILIEDLTAYLKAHRAEPSAPAARKRDAPELDLGRPGTRVKLTGLRRKSAEHLATVVRSVPHFTYVDECDVSDLVRLRQSLREPMAARGVKLTYLAFVVKAVALALKDVPAVNASYDEAAGEVTLHDQYHVGVAVATPAGLVVPVIRDADRKDLPTIAREAEELGAAARAGKLRREQVTGGTFTVTSIGGFGGLFATPIINHPESAILGVGKVVRRPVYDDAGAVRPADLMYLSLSCDHRVIDGAVAAVFANAVILRLKNPGLLLLPSEWV
jgi:2-oxoisovalerate dehydrogenase E2 component (dihydrolipoyl transacylase)